MLIYITHISQRPQFASIRRAIRWMP